MELHYHAIFPKYGQPQDFEMCNVHFQKLLRLIEQ